MQMILAAAVHEQQPAGMKGRLFVLFRENGTEQQPPLTPSSYDCAGWGILYRRRKYED